MRNEINIYLVRDPLNVPTRRHLSWRVLCHQRKKRRWRAVCAQRIVNPFPNHYTLFACFFCVCVLIIKGSSREKCVCGLGPLNDTKRTRTREQEYKQTKKTRPIIFFYINIHSCFVYRFFLNL